jgi:hypothetical protein
MPNQPLLPARSYRIRGRVLAVALAGATVATVAATGRLVEEPLWRARPPTAGRFVAPPRLEWSPGATPAAISAEAQRLLALVAGLTTPTCALGHAALCDALQPPVDACAAGDGAACFAVAERLDRQPPYAAGAVFVYAAACRLGVEAGCAASAATAPLDCAVDVGRCAAAARGDRERLAPLCARGSADACAMMAIDADGTPIGDAYLIAACQRGGALACGEVARRYAGPDPALAAVAGQLACEAGVADACGGPSS